MGHYILVLYIQKKGRYHQRYGMVTGQNVNIISLQERDEIKRSEHMARDDYFVIVYRILAYLYVCLKEGKEPDIAYISSDSPALKINQNYWEYIFRHLLADGYLEGVALVPVVGRTVPEIKVGSNVTITPKGIEFLQNNSTMSRAKDFLKTLKETIPGI